MALCIVTLTEAGSSVATVLSVAYKTQRRKEKRTDGQRDRHK